MVFMGKIISMVVKKSRSDNRYCQRMLAGNWRCSSAYREDCFFDGGDAGLNERWSLQLLIQTYCHTDLSVMMMILLNSNLGPLCVS